MTTSKSVFSSILGSLSFVVLFLMSCDNDIVETGDYRVNEDISTIEWKGIAKDHYHVGSFDLEGQLVSDANGSVKSGQFTIPISSIKNFDLEGEVREQLLTHLKSPDFFNVAIYPNATFEFKKIEPYNTVVEGAIEDANYVVTGDFSMLGKKHSVSFPARMVSNKNSLSVDAKFAIDRTKWGMTYESDPDEPLYIFPNVEIKLKLIAEKVK